MNAINKDWSVDPYPRVGGYAVIGVGESTVAVVTQRDESPTRTGITKEESIERATLIAAAPELLAALQAAEMALLGYSHQNTVTLNAIAMARAAIAKAGSQS